jgi:hypothetical protein
LAARVRKDCWDRASCSRHSRYWLCGDASIAALVLAAVVCGSGWFLNAGTRFLIPAAVFVALALASVLPPRAAWGLAIAQAVLCWPAVLDRYAPANAWRLPSAWPWRAALRLEPEAEYLRRLAPETLISNMVDRHAKAGERVLDFGEAPRAYAHGAELLAGWQYTPARRAMTALLAAHSTVSRPLYTLRGEWPRRKLRSIRFEQRAAGHGGLEHSGGTNLARAGTLVPEPRLGTRGQFEPVGSSARF